MTFTQITVYTQITSVYPTNFEPVRTELNHETEHLTRERGRTEVLATGAGAVKPVVISHTVLAIYMARKETRRGVAELK